MKWSRYNKIFHSLSGGYILFNSMSQCLLQIAEEDIETFRYLENNPDNYKDFEGYQVLLNYKILVEDDDMLLSYHIDTILRNRYNPNDINLTIAVTRDCNFSCVYCYETERPAIYMREKEEDEIVAFLSKNKQLRSVLVTWYGGEPLLNFRCIQRLTSKIKKLGVHFSAMIVTNGFLLTENICNKFKELNINKVQVTLDGPKSIHDTRRFLKNGTGTYDRIVENLKYLHKIYPEIQIDIRTNIDKRIEHEYIAFYKYLKTVFGAENVRPYAGFASDIMNSGCISDEYSLNTNIDKANFYIRNHENNVDIDNYMPRKHISTCIANSLTGLVIGPEGEVYKCWLEIGNPKCVIGNIANPMQFDLIKMSKYTCLADYVFDPKCRDCFFMPICSGGCPLARILNKKIFIIHLYISEFIGRMIYNLVQVNGKNYIN